MDGVPLAARFSLPTNQRNFCGPADAGGPLYEAATAGRRVEEAGAALLKFEALAPYLEAIGRRHGLAPLDARVVEAYWIGNELLDVFGRDDFRAILDALSARGLPASIARRLAAHLPARPIPHHLFHVAFVGVGAVTGHVPTTLPNMEACRPAAARVVALRDGRLRTLVAPLRAEAERLVLGTPEERTYPYDPALLPGLRPGATVALHWETPVLELTEDQADALAAYTARSLAAANEALPGLGVLRASGFSAGGPTGPR